MVISVGEQTGLSAFRDVPEHIFLRPRVDQLAVLARASVFVTHCGMNSASEGLYFGVPLVLYPQQAEQGLVARRVEELGAGAPLEESLAGGHPGGGAPGTGAAVLPQPGPGDRRRLPGRRGIPAGGGQDFRGGGPGRRGLCGKSSYAIIQASRPCLKIGNVSNGEEFFRQARRFDAAILCVLQGKSTQYGGKRPAVWAY